MVCASVGDFARLERYLEGLRREQFKADNDAELADALEQLQYLLLFFDVEPELGHRFAQTYDQTARRVYGEPLARPATRREGRIRVGYLSADLRNHVMGKMIWQAVSHHDRERFEICFFSLSAERDDWTARFESIADRFEVLAGLTRARRRAARSPPRISTSWSTCRNPHQGVAAGHPRAQARAGADHPRGERGYGRTLGDRFQADRRLRRHAGEPGDAARDAA